MRNEDLDSEEKGVLTRIRLKEILFQEEDKDQPGKKMRVSEVRRLTTNRARSHWDPALRPCLQPGPPAPLGTVNTD